MNFTVRGEPGVGELFPGVWGLSVPLRPTPSPVAWCRWLTEFWGRCSSESLPPSITPKHHAHTHTHTPCTDVHAGPQGEPVCEAGPVRPRHNRTVITGNDCLPPGCSTYLITLPLRYFCLKPLRGEERCHSNLLRDVVRHLRVDEIAHRAH